MSVEIQLTDKWWLVSDTHSWELAERKWRTWKDKKTGQQREGWVFIGNSWHPTIEDVCRACLEKELRSSDAKSLEELRQIARSTKDMLVAATQGLDLGARVA